MKPQLMPPPNIGRAEMDILRYIQDHHPLSVREVAAHVSATKGHVRTTVLNVMDRLRKKGFLKRKKVEGVFLYSPSVPQADLLRRLVRDFVTHTLGGSVSPFVAYLCDEGALDGHEVAELQRLVGELRARTNEEHR